MTGGEGIRDVFVCEKPREQEPRESVRGVAPGRRVDGYGVRRVFEEEEGTDRNMGVFGPGVGRRGGL